MDEASKVRQSKETRVTNDANRSGIWVRIVGGVFAGAVVLAAAALCYKTSERASSDRKREMENLALALAEQTERAFEALELVQLSIIERIGNAGVTDKSQLATAMHTVEVHQILRDKIDALPYVDAVTVIDKTGRLLNFSRYWPIPPVNVSDRDYFQALKQMSGPDVFVSAPVPNRGTGTITIYLARRFTSPDGRFLGLVLGAMVQSYFERYFSAINLGRDGAILMFRNDGAYLAGHPHSDPDAEAVAMRQRVSSALISAPPDDALAPPGLLDDKERLYAAKGLSKYPVTVFVTDTLGAVNRRAFDQSIPIIVFAGLICASIFIVVVLAERHLRAQRRFAYDAYHSARHDALTGLPNRLSFSEALDAALKALPARQGLALLFIDLDYFKSVNDTLGHAIGDDLLRGVAGRIAGCLPAGASVARIGGDEFSVILPQAGETEALRIAHTIIEAIREPFELEHHRVIPGGSIGVALAPVHGAMAPELLKNADLALYRAKADGRGLARVFERELERSALTRRNLELDLDAAWREGQFFVVYQPIFDCRTCEIVSFEALLRWRHPTRGVVPAPAFIPVAEDTGLIFPLGGWVLEQACRAARAWPAGISVSVNLSPIQFRGNRVESQVADALAASGLSTSRLELEITETALIQEGPAALSVIEGFREKGIRVALDDFGTGYSSLAYLRKLPIDRIKIDHAFVDGLGRDHHSLPIIRAILALAATLPLATTVEGVERDEQLEILRKEGCTHVQGYLLGRPVSLPEACALLRTETIDAAH
ncbi:EAL domain-containing protein [Aquabacter spiritensis]|uniref:Diguanylate cyclase (GGDEF)-like protein n=1 Tax=Aquabacter spiritensis TaxID=933073 RepID=A0A4R3M476_9HYPH|nr:EAL domain-containing protein [Aquabacter spiritensis]TCT08094.1 diguanylate cyclase (GGDEF)-like protein [Aquabacter spiritensis]